MTSEFNQLLIDYGLTRNQSKVFSVLTKNNRYLNAKEISKLAGLARQTVYHNLLALKKMGLVQETIGFPKKYSAIPIKRALTILHDQKKFQLHKLESLTTDVLFKLNNKNIKNNIIQEDHQFILIPKKKQFIKSVSNKILHSRKSVNIITSWKRYTRLVTVFEKTLKKALENDVIFQVLVTETPKDHMFSKIANLFHDHPNASVKFFERLSEINVITIDEKEIFLITEPKADFAESPILWSNNSSLVAALIACFSLFKNKALS
jgi:sugar-specific transcriptional regulator TrmB